MAFFFGFSFYSCFFLDVSTLGSYIFIMCSVGISEPPGPSNIARCIPLKGHSEGLLNVYEEFLRIIAELAERSPITIRNSSNPSSPKKFGCTTVQGATFSMRGQLYHGHYLSHYVMEGRGRR